MYLRPDSQSVYDVAQVCLNGHVTNGFSRSSPEFNETFCSNCGERTITVCPACNHAIRGQIAGSIIVCFGSIQKHYEESGRSCSGTTKKYVEKLPRNR